MAKLCKKSLSDYFRSSCQRQFVLSLYEDDERKRFGLPPKPKTGADFKLVGQNGFEWQNKKIAELTEFFGAANVRINPVAVNKRPKPIDLLTVLPSALAHQFLIEAHYEADTGVFRNALGIGNLTDFFGNVIDIEATRPDIIQVLPPLATTGTQPSLTEDPAELQVLPDGETERLQTQDTRLRLRVIDVKISAKPGSYHFSETVYYSMTLAAWLVENKLDDRFVVIAAPAVWSGSQEESNLVRQMAKWRRLAYVPTPAEMCKALDKDLEIAQFEVFAISLRALFNQQIPQMLSQTWQELDWHVNYECKGCPFLGFPQSGSTGNAASHPAHCYPTAEKTGNLSQVAGLSRGAAKYLKSEGISDIAALAANGPASEIYDGHQNLRAKRAVIPPRAKSLSSKTTSIIPNSGGDALMPLYPELRIFVFLDFDLSTTITSAIGIRAAWREPLPFSSPEIAKTKHWTRAKGSDEVFLIDSQSIQRERAEFLKFLRHLKGILDQVVSFDKADAAAGRRDKKTKNSRYQIYLWDESQKQQLIRMTGRHLPQILTDRELRDTAWLFPPSELLPKAEDATRQSPLTIVWNVVNNTVSTPVPHHYALMELVKYYHPPKFTPPEVDPLYYEPMSDLVPAEQVHRWWWRIGNWHANQNMIEQTIRKKVLALDFVTKRLEHDLKDKLHRLAAPPIMRQPQKHKVMAPQSKLWLEYARLNTALDNFERQTNRSMPPHEREARGKAARLKKRLTGTEEKRALKALSKTAGRKVSASPNLFVYEMRKNSSEVNFRPGEIGFALSPELTSGMPPKSHHGFLDEHPFRYVKGTSLESWGKRKAGETFETLKLTEVSIEAIDRLHGYIALQAGNNCIIPQLEAESNIPLDFSKNVILDKIHNDYLTKKIKLTLEGIGFPSRAVPDQRTIEALGLAANLLTGTSAQTPAAEILWDTQKVYAQLTRHVLSRIQQEVKKFLKSREVNLDSSQWRAWNEALRSRFSIIWGPPGTGKSRTLRAVILGAVLDGLENNRSVRLLITANTYTAMDNVLLEAEAELAAMFPHKPFSIYRVQNSRKELSPEISAKYPNLKQLNLNRTAPSPEVIRLTEELNNPKEITIIGCLPQQLHNLATIKTKPPLPEHTQKEWFDFIILDEASQMDVATSTLVFTKLAADGACVLAGDDLQLPPIQKAEPPLDLDHLVGSIYNYFRHHQGIEPKALDVNYRSNETIVELTKIAGYNAALKSYSPDLKIDLMTPVPTVKPALFPPELFWTSNWAELLAPECPAVCFVYDDEASSQSNDFEADAVASLIWLLNDRLANKLLSERQPGGTINRVKATAPYAKEKFWEKAVGVVTPHRAQMSKIIGRLQQIFPAHDPERIRNAVDTVERFQGQQRDVIIASFGLGDPDLIIAEEEFLFNLNRFNVLSSRSRAKLIVFATRTLLEHLSNDKQILEQSRFLKQFAESFCRDSKQLQLGFNKGGKIIPKKGILRVRRLK